jgi:hypothetical protein
VLPLENLVLRENANKVVIHKVDILHKRTFLQTKSISVFNVFFAENHDLSTDQLQVVNPVCSAAGMENNASVIIATLLKNGRELVPKFNIVLLVVVVVDDLVAIEELCRRIESHIRNYPPVIDRFADRPV